VLYNARLKRVMLVDVVTVALGFALRAAAGAVAIEIPISVWLLLCVFFLCLYLGFVKRLCDLVAAEHEAGTTWHSPAGYRSRHELDWLLGVSGVLAVVTYLMYAMSAHAWRLFGLRAFGFAVMTPLVLIAMHRFYRRAGLGSSDSPLAALREDRIVLASITLFVAGTVLSLYAPGLDTLFGKVFVSVHGTAGP
jgi:4-hydroxybenzoate polyprenyltransferase